jgi:hypothetical protein
MKRQLRQKLVVRRASSGSSPGLDLIEARGADAGIAFDSEPASCVTKPTAVLQGAMACAGV